MHSIQKKKSVHHPEEVSGRFVLVVMQGLWKLADPGCLKMSQDSNPLDVSLGTVGPLAGGV